MKWLKAGWGEDFSPVFNKKEKYRISFENMIKSSDDIVVVANRAIKKITESYPPPYTLMVSGGIDSQTMLWLWIQSKVPFNAVSFRYLNADKTGYLNDHDLVELKQFSEIHNIDVTYKDFDVIHFLENDLQQVAEKYQCTSPQICTHMKMSENIKEGTIIFSGNFASDTLHYDYTIFGLKRYADNSRRNIIPFFLLHDRELAGAVQHQKQYPRYLDRVAALLALNIPAIPQPLKLTGFEKIKDYYDDQSVRVNPREKIKYSNMPSKRVFDVLFRYRLTEKIKYQDPIIFLNPENSGNIGRESTYLDITSKSVKDAYKSNLQ